MKLDKKKHVAVLGAGITGLMAAYHLSGYGHKVTVIETQPRVGGRAVTIRSFFHDELIGQAGPSRFPADFKRVLEYTRRLGLELVPFYPDYGTVVAYFKGKRIEEYQPSPEEFWGYTAIVNRYPGRAESMSLRLALWLRSLARRILRRPRWMTYSIRGGTDLLTDALAEATDADFRLESTAQSISQDPDGVRVSFVTQEGSETLEVDYVICALPLSVINKLDFSPAIASEKTDLMDAIPFASAIRIFLQMKRAYWRDEGHNGFAVTDTLGEIWDPHFDAPGEPALLVSYAKDELADKLCALSEDERIECALEELEKIFPGAKTHFEKGTSYCWNEQPWIMGGWPLVREGFSHRVKVFREPEGRIHFAGDYAAAPTWLNTMEGAIESGEYAASRINEEH